MVGADLSFAEQILRHSRKQRSKYIDWIPSTSCEVERLFSRAGHVLTCRRRSMDPTTMESLMFLEFNRRLWDPQLVAHALTSVEQRKGNE